MHYWFGWGHMIWMTIGWLVGVGLLVALIWGIILAANGRLQEREPPETILKRRFAAGEIETDELKRRLEDANCAVIMKLGRNLPKVRRALRRAGRLDRAIYVERGTTANAASMRLTAKTEPHVASPA